MLRSRPFPPRRLAALAAVATLLAASGASPQSEESTRFGETVDVVVVQVEVVVTDRGGRRVGGLGRQDFRLLVNGRETAIDYFFEVREGREVIGATQVEAMVSATHVEAAVEGAGDGVPEPAGGAAPGGPVATNHLIFIDDYFAIRRQRNRVLKAIGEQLEALGPEDRVAVMAFDGRELELLAPWTSSPREVSRALDAAARRPAHGLMRAHERAARGEDGPWTDRVVQREELERLFASVRATLQMLPRPEGRKTLLLLGGGWPVRVLLPTVEDETGLLRPLPTLGDTDARFDDLALVHELAGAAGLLGYTLYPVDVQGLRAPGDAASAEPAPLDQSGAMGAFGGAHTAELFRQGTLHSLAQATGGRALLAADRGRALEAVVEDTRSYYSLGFTPRLARDDASHEVRVEVARPGLRVRSRTAYLDVSRAAELDLLAESALRFRDAEGAEAADEGAPQIPMRVSLGKPRRAERGTMTVDLRVDLPWGAIALVPAEGGGLAGLLEVRVAARDRDGTLSEVARHYVELERDEPPGERSVLRWEADLTLRRERHELVVTLHDAVSGHLAIQRVTVEP